MTPAVPPAADRPTEGGDREALRTWTFQTRDGRGAWFGPFRTEDEARQRFLDIFGYPAGALLETGSW